MLGPTAAGKSRVAVELARQLDGEVIGLDSRQIYRHMPVGTAQPAEKERGGIPHHLIGIRDPGEVISAGEYAHLVEETIKGVQERGNVPIVCGGSGLYYRALTCGIFEESSSDLDIRKKLQAELEKKGVAKLLRRLRTVDPEYAKIVHPNNHKRLIRALEIHKITGKAPSDHFKSQQKRRSDDTIFSVYLRASLDFLEERIRRRTDEMLDRGWIEEVQSLMEMGVDQKFHPVDSLGYRQIMSYLDGTMNRDQMIERINIETRQYAKKQLKWFDREKINLKLDLSKDRSLDNTVATIFDGFKMFGSS
ncbi:MAG: tRNA (adenosine(37)-N6)-dimethylallyltransferase MiaA [Candidatus Marinimicrobia bacterium]|nr:tRNA (adenosine(37)-N6)-dimethylallyltransferase MiaA [Candidatus Neomarinimicrobiota bacterium]